MGAIIYPTKVDLEKPVPYDSLETALKKAAKDMKWGVNIKDTYEKRYQLGSVKKVERHWSTEIKVKKFGLPMLKISVYDKDHPERFYIRAGFLEGTLARKKKVM
ncbi:hypothetical protein KY341_06525, partial [Candidatus Woesearchaeota archaeon]|nr:hypothetical protein [Candidatus Woesearchaeota archaeon]